MELFIDGVLLKERIIMLEILKFTFESFGHFVGVCFLIAWFFLGIILVVVAFGFALDNYKPGKH